MTARRFAHYELEELIGVGGMGEVWRAMDTRRDRVVALKLLPEALCSDAEFVHRFKRESHVAARLREPHVIPIHDYGDIDGRLFIDMRLVDGHDLGEMLKSGPIAPQRAVALLSQVAEALEAAHADGLVHRDIKPSNVLVTANDFVYVVDFGIARSMGSTTSSLTMTGATVGTLAYMAPERFTNQPLDGRVDVYSLACVLAESLTATRPFHGEDLASLLYAHLYTDPPRPSSLSPGVPAALDAVVQQGMAKRPEDRYATPKELIAAAREALAPAPADVPPPRLPGSGPAVAPAAPVTTREPSPGSSALPVDVGLRAQDGSHSSVDRLPAPPSPVGGGPRGPRGPGAGGGTDEAGQPDRPATEPGRRRRSPVVLAGALALVLVAGLLAWLLWPEGGTAATDAGDPGPSATGTAPGPGTPLPPGSAPSTAPEITSEPSIAVPTVFGDPIAVRPTPGNLAIAPNGRYAYIAHRAEGVITVLDTTSNAVTATIPIEAGPPQFITFSPDGETAYVTIYNADYSYNAVSFVETRSNRVTATVEVGLRPFAPATSPDGSLLYVPLHDEGRVQVIDTASSEEVDSYEVAPNPHWIVVSEDGTVGYTANHESGVVSVLDLTDGGRVITTVRVGQAPHSVALSPDGTRLSVVNYESSTLSVIDTATNAVVTTVEVGAKPQDVSYAADGRHLYTADVDGGTVSVVDTETNRVTATIPIGRSPTTVAVVPDGSRAYVTNLEDSTVRILRLTAA